ncbi:DoxX family protein [Alkalihalobacterium alkalinitrilicum]|uniref:DoxX family protein n=1 Tax=Alkalihalobacterium alkalinitrilicum TaxID=427920 RepID=UPI00099492D9|nr:DoxX family protein [Alkalihalobacterium alkalinitrilicum]
MLKKHEVGAFILRVVLGLSFFIHGLDKFQAGIGNIAGFFESLGIPGFLAYVVALIELVGGIALVLGIGTRVVSILIAIIMVGAVFTFKFSVGFLDGYELDLAFLAMSIYLAITNKSAYAVDNVIFSSKQE